jgi:hypothetical protein
LFLKSFPREALVGKTSAVVHSAGIYRAAYRLRVNGVEAKAILPTNFSETKADLKTVSYTVDPLTTTEPT